MSLLRRINLVGRSGGLFVLLVGVFLVVPSAWAGPQLWLYPGENGPRQGGHLLPLEDFTLVVENRAKDSDENVAQEVRLVVAVNDPGLIGNLSLAEGDGTPIELSAWVEGTPELPCSFKPMPRHSVYPAFFALAELADLPGGERHEIDVTVDGEADVRLHFDAMAIAWKNTGKGPKCSDVSNPPGHDVTVGQRPGGGHDDCGRVRIRKSADEKYVDFGDTVTFEIEVSNEGTCDLTDPVLRDFIPTVEDETDGTVAAFSVSGGTVPSPSREEEFLVEWDLVSPLASGEIDGVILEVVFDQPAADGQRIVNRACISAEELRKPRCAAAVVIVGNPRGEDGPAGPGFWCHATRFMLEDRRNAPVDSEDFDEWLIEIGDGSDVFHDELYDASRPELARDLLCTPQSAAGAADRLARHLLTLWLNVVSGRISMDQELDELCDGDEIMPDDVEAKTVMELITAVEDALLAPEDDQVLSYWSEVVDAVNNSLVPGEPGCMEPLTTSGRQRAGGSSPGKNLAAPAGER
jgi:uncharacterized repeat protein (TIGR01451 family)